MSASYRPPTDRVLSFSGGGVRGYLSILMFEEYCKRLYKSYFRGRKEMDLDMFVDKIVLSRYAVISGTSIGGIIAVLLAIGTPLSRVKDALRHPQEVFKKNSVLNPLTSTYNTSGLEKLYTDVLKDKDGTCKYKAYLRDDAKQVQVENLRLYHLTRVCAVTTYDLNSSMSYWLSNKKLPEMDSRPLWDDVRLIDACLSTSAAPTYFPVHKFTHKDQDMQCVDGGIWANDAALVGLFLARESFQGQEPPETRYHVYAFGTGYPTKKPWVMDGDGKLGWITPKNRGIPLLTLFDASTAAVDQFMSGFELLNVISYFPFDIELKKDIILDNVDSIPDQEQAFNSAVGQPPKKNTKSRDISSVLDRALQEYEQELRNPSANLRSSL